MRRCLRSWSSSGSSSSAAVTVGVASTAVEPGLSFPPAALAMVMSGSLRSSEMVPAPMSQTLPSERWRSRRATYFGRSCGCNCAWASARICVCSSWKMGLFSRKGSMPGKGDGILDSSSIRWQRRRRSMGRLAHLELFHQPGAVGVSERRIERLRVVDVQAVAAALVDGVYERLQVERHVRIGAVEWDRDGGQGAQVTRGPDAAHCLLVPSSNEQIVRSLREGIEHRHARAAAEQVDLDEVGSAEQQCLPFAQVLLAAGGALPFVRRRQHLDTGDEPAFGFGGVDLDELLAELLGDEGP